VGPSALDERPSSLAGLTTLEIWIFAQSGELTPEEQAWFSSRENSTLMNGQPTALSWMR